MMDKSAYGNDNCVTALVLLFCCVPMQMKHLHKVKAFERNFSQLN